MDNQQGNLQEVMEKHLSSVAYSVGALLGDGNVKTYSYFSKAHNNFVIHHQVAISNMDLICIKRVCAEINSLFGTSYKIYEYRNPNRTMMFRLVLSNEIISKFFQYFIGEKLSIVDEVFRADRLTKINFLTGLFDTDGYIAESNGYFRIGYAARQRTLVEDVARLLQMLGVKVGQIYEQISGHGTKMFVIKPNIRSFLDAGCSFFISRKFDKLLKYKETTRYQSPRRTFRDYNVTPSMKGEDIVQVELKDSTIS